MKYRRADIAGATYFFTVKLADRTSNLHVDHIDIFREAVRKIRETHPFEIVAMVIMPNHLHAVWNLPENDADFPLRWSLIKATFSRKIPKTETINGSRKIKRERGIWQRRYWEHQIRDEIDLEAHVAYIYMNPVKHGYVAKASDWPYSSIHKEIRLGRIDANWGHPKECQDGQWGE
jgi:putative transposase